MGLVIVAAAWTLHMYRESTITQPADVLQAVEHLQDRVNKIAELAEQTREEQIARTERVYSIQPKE